MFNQLSIKGLNFLTTSVMPNITSLIFRVLIKNIANKMFHTASKTNSHCPILIQTYS
jgi:hypothetical protein